MTTLICEIGSLLVRWVAAYVPGQPGLLVFSDLLLFCSLVSAGVSMLLMVLVLKLRTITPPREIIAASTLIAAAPWVVLALRAAGLVAL